MQSHFEVIGVRASISEFGGQGTQFSPLTEVELPHYKGKGYKENFLKIQLILKKVERIIC